VTFETNGGTAASSVTVRADNAAVTLPSTTRTGYAFDGWFNNAGLSGSALTSPYTAAASITLYAKWTALYTVTFNSNGGSSVDPVTVRSGASVSKPANPTRANYRFDGWLLPGGSAASFPYAPTANITLTAAWTFQYTVTLDNNNSTSLITQIVTQGESLALPTYPTKSSYVFMGWYESPNIGSSKTNVLPVMFPWVPTGTIAAITLYARWVPSSTFSSTTTRDNYDYHERIMTNSLFSSNIKFLDIAMLGAHDAFTHNLSSDSAWDSLDPNYPSSFERWLANSRVSALSKAQTSDAYTMAKYGARLFDVRLTRYNNSWYTAHGKISNTYASYITDTLKFMEEHPREVIVFDIQRILYGGVSADDVFTLMANTKYNGKSLLDYINYDTSVKTLSQLTYGDLVGDGNAGFVMFVPTDASISAANAKKIYRHQTQVRAVWHNTDETSNLVNGIEAEYNTLLNTTTYNGYLRVNQAQLTPQYSSISDIMNILSESLVGMSHDACNVIITRTNFLNGNWFKVMPVMWVDDATYTNISVSVIPVIYTANLRLR
jgi:uncharacterized repeat protein (TIGR02543 family)